MTNMNKIVEKIICYRFTKCRHITRRVDKKTMQSSSILITSYYITMHYVIKQLLLRPIRNRLRLRRTNISSSILRDILDRNRRVFPRGVTTSRVLSISLCAPEGWRRLIVLEKFNFDDADGRPNSERRIGIQAKDLTYRSPLSRTSLRPKLPGHGDRYTRVPRSSPSARVQESQNFHIDFSRLR